MEANIETNLFKIKSLPFKKVYKFSIFTDIKDPEKDNIYKLAAKRKAVRVDTDTYDVISYEKPVDISYEELDFEEISEPIQERLLYFYFKNIINNINRNLPAENYETEKINIKQELKHSVVKIENNFYLGLDIKYQILTKTDIWKHFDFNPKLIKKGLKVKDILNPTSTAEIIDVVLPKDERYQKKLNEIIESYKRHNRKFNKKYENQPIITIKFLGKKTPYDYLAERLKLVRYPSEIGLNIQKKLKIPNEKRKEKIINIIKGSNLKDICEDKPFIKKGKIFNDIRIKTVYNGESKVKNIIKVKGKLPQILPYRVPNLLKNKEIEVFIIADQSLKNIKELKEQKPLRTILNSLMLLKNENKNEYPTFYNANKKYDVPYSFKLNEVEKLIKELKSLNLSSDIPPLVITLGSKNHIKSKNDYYEDLKRRLFNIGFLHQNILFENIIKSYAKKPSYQNQNFEIENLILQILCKYGMYPYVLDVGFDFDYIIGVDVANDEYGNRRIGGGISIFNKNGVLESIIPLKINTGGEKVDLKYLLEKLSDHLSVKDKKILILRDGKLTQSEIKSALEKSSDLEINSLTFLNVVKRHNLRIFDDKVGRKGVILKENLALLLNHSFEGARSIKIDSKYKIEDGKVSRGNINYQDLELLYNLSNLNYSNLRIKSGRLKYPAPIHYSDKFVKAVSKRWEINEKLLLEGFLYFL